MDWQVGDWDGYYGLGEQMAALEVIQNTLYKEMPLPYTAANGGTSQGDAAAGMNSTVPDPGYLRITNGDRIGASLVAALFGLSCIGLLVFVLIG
jgi:mannan endo-1,6-alpha-mannosidase